MMTKNKGIRFIVDINLSNSSFFVSCGKEAKTIHDLHFMLVQKNARSKWAYYPDKGHAWLFSDVDTHIQLLRDFFQNAAFPEKLKGF